jgi:hypothetical protein
MLQTRSSRLARTLFLPAATALLALSSAPAEAKPRIGLGGGLGDPTGPSLKIFLHPQHALQFDAGWAPAHHGHGIIHGNYLFHFKPFVHNKVMDFGLYLGVGVGMAFWSRYWHYGWHSVGYYGRCDGPGRRDSCYYGHGGGAALMARAPVGLYFHWAKIPIDTVVEGGWSPYLFWPDLFHGDFSAKIRYYF